MSATNSYAEEAAQRWPVEYVESNLKLKSMSKEDQQKLFKLGSDNIKDIADAFVLQKAADSAEVQKLVKIHYNWVSVFWTPTKDAYIGLGAQCMYQMKDSRKTTTSTHQGVQHLWLRQCSIYAQENLSN
jgi:hypothetical protein